MEDHSSLEKKLDDAVQEYIINLREHGSAINTVKTNCYCFSKAFSASHGSHKAGRIWWPCPINYSLGKVIIETDKLHKKKSHHEL